MVKPPRAYRAVDRALVAGVAAGLSAHSRFAVWAIRIAFILASVWKFSGAVAYAVLWLLLPREEKIQPIGLVAAERQGLRTVAHKDNYPQVLGWFGSFLIGMGIALLIRYYDRGLMGELSLFVFAVGVGIGLVWLTRETEWPRWAKALMAFWGICMAWSAGTFIQARVWSLIRIDVQPGMENYLTTLFFSGTAMIGCVLVVLPWIVHPARSEEAKQLELIAETRADMAAHLHDSVLQTLAVIQKSAADPATVARLARRQEKELREWLYGDQADEESAIVSLKEVIAELEATYPVTVELVSVGDHEMTVEVDAVVRAAREAIQNAAKHSGATQIDVYAEMSGDKAEVYVRDRGKGFKMDDIGDDRMGIRRSIVDRMERYGGSVDIRSTVSEGTEIHLSMPLTEEGATND